MFTHNDGLRVYAGSRYIAPELTDEIVLDLAGHATKQATIVGPTPMPHTNAYQTFTRVRVEWDDMDMPDLYPRFWDALLGDVIASRKDLVIMCFGGHGRTGTALAIVASLLGAIPEDECPVQWVRDHYCKEAVETEVQAKYIQTVTNHPIKTKVGADAFDMKGFSWRDH